MKKLHKIISFIPFFIIGYWLFCAIILLRTNFYLKYFYILDIIDSFLVYFTVIHFIAFRKEYNYRSRIFLQCIYLIILLNFVYIFLDELKYYFLYYLIIITHILVSFWKR